MGLGLHNSSADGGGGCGGLEIVEREILRVVDAAKTGKDVNMGGKGGGAGDSVGGAGGDRDGGADAGIGVEREGEAKDGKEERESRVILILDGLDFLLAATGTTALQMGDLVGEIRSVCHPPLSPCLKPIYLFLTFGALDEIG